MWSAEKTDPLSLVHPRSANVTVLSAGQGLSVTAITAGTLHFMFDATVTHQPFASLSLSVDGSFVTVTVPRVLGTEYLKEALHASLPEGYLVLAHPSDPASGDRRRRPEGDSSERDKEALIVTIARATEVEPTPHLFCTSYDTTMRARKVGTNRLLLKGIARGKGDLQVRINERELRLRLSRGETPMALAVRLRELLKATHLTLLSVPGAPDGEVVLTVLPRR
jgi:hypothetical protein